LTVNACALHLHFREIPKARNRLSSLVSISCVLKRFDGARPHINKVFFGQILVDTLGADDVHFQWIVDIRFRGAGPISSILQP